LTAQKSNYRDHNNQNNFSHDLESHDITKTVKPVVSLILPAYNEAAIIEENLGILEKYIKSLERYYRWEILIVNDGSIDETGQLAEAFAKERDNVRVLHHGINFGLGQALKFAFNHTQADYLVVYDLDLSYEPYHIGKLLKKITTTNSRVVVASPYMKAGKISNVPWFRKTLSIWANRFLAFAVKGDIVTLTGMVRVYDGKFLRSLNLRSMGMEINPEVIHKTMLLNARIEEIPAHLRWKTPKANHKQRKRKKRQQRVSSMKILRHTMAVILSGFIFRPVMFFLIPGLILLLLSLYANIWVLIHCWQQYQIFAQETFFPDLTEVVAAAFYQVPHAFIIGGMSLIIAIQFLSIGILSLQTKNYFEEIFYLGSAIYKSTKKD